MERYVVMLRADIDDRDITEWALDEIGTDIAVKFIAGIDELDKEIVACLLTTGKIKARFTHQGSMNLCEVSVLGNKGGPGLLNSHILSE